MSRSARAGGFGVSFTLFSQWVMLMSDREPSWLDARPSLRVSWLQWCNLWRRWPFAAATATGALLMFGVLGRIGAVGHLIERAASAPRMVLAVATVIATTLVLRHRRRVASQWPLHWLAPLPHDLAVATRAAAAALTVWFAVAAEIALVSGLAHVPAWVTVRLLVCGSAGVVFGVLLAAVLSMRGMTHGESEPPRSRFAAVRRSGVAMAWLGSLRPLGAWPLAETRYRDRPSIRARSLILLLLAVPMGTSGGVALAAATGWLLALHLLNLLLSLVRSAFSAARWLGPTPLRPVHFAVALSHQILIAQILGCAALSVIVYVALGAVAAREALALSGLWVSAAGTVGAGMCVLALRSRSIAASVMHRGWQ